MGSFSVGHGHYLSPMYSPMYPSFLCMRKRSVKNRTLEHKLHLPEDDKRFQFLVNKKRYNCNIFFSCCAALPEMKQVKLPPQMGKRQKVPPQSKEVC